jgi:hypothetical protein
VDLVEQAAKQLTPERTVLQNKQNTKPPTKPFPTEKRAADGKKARERLTHSKKTHHRLPWRRNSDTEKKPSHLPNPSRAARREERQTAKKPEKGSHTVKKRTTAYPGGGTLTRKRRLRIQIGLQPPVDEGPDARFSDPRHDVGLERLP